MKRILLNLLIFLSISAAMAQDCPIIPLPNKAESQSKTFKITKYTPIVVEDPLLSPQAHFLQQELLKTTGLTLSIQPRKNGPAIVFSKSKGKADTEGEYKLRMNAEEINISSATSEGVFNGSISLIQLVRNAKGSNPSADKGGANKQEAVIGCWNIEDAPKYSWRGILLDESRHFFGKETVKSMLDWMAYYKLNHLHWHLTDAPGWRMEIKQYPKLTLVGGIGDYSNPLKPAQYYTQEDIKEIVRYAAERFITVVPEVDMPGHAAAANRAYPEFSGGGSEKHPDFTFNPGNEATYQYLANILQETNALFPSDMIHLGGDEVHFGNENWNHDPHVKQLMQDKNLKDLKAVEQYFMQRMADTLFKMNNKVLLWDEAAGSDLPGEKTVVFWWRHDRPEQLKMAFDKGFSAVLCPRLPFYLDFVQDSTQQVGRRWKGGLFNPLENVYNFSTASLPAPKNPKQILGVQGALWTERIATDQKLEYMLFPRICALAENAWTEDKNRNFEDFDSRLKSHLNLFQTERIYFYNPKKPQQNPEPLLPGDVSN